MRAGTELSGGQPRTVRGTTCEGGHPFRWTSDDVEHARQLANTIAARGAMAGPHPNKAWNLRSPILAEERQAFAAALGQQRQWAARELDLDLRPN